MRFATWNVNSIRARGQRVVDWLSNNDVDVLAIQETKCKNEQFPEEIFTNAGYQIAFTGTNQWNGVAIASRIGLEDIEYSFPNQPTYNSDPEGLFDNIGTLEPRAIGATCGNLRIWSLYVPNGREISNPHFEYKIKWLEALHESAIEMLKKYPYLSLSGDWNIAPNDSDVWDIKFFEGKTHVTPEERNCFNKFLTTGFIDPVTPKTPGEYTYWDYTSLRFQKKEGMRIDFSLVSKDLANKISHVKIDREERKGKGASDHAPVICDFDQ